MRQDRLDPLFREFRGRIRVLASPEVLARRRGQCKVEECQDSAHGVVDARDRVVPSDAIAMVETVEVGVDEAVLRAVGRVQARARHPRLGEDPIDTHRANAELGEQCAGGVEESFRGRPLGGGFDWGAHAEKPIGSSR